MLAVAHWLGVFEQVSEPAEIKRTLVQLGPWGYVAFVVAFAVLQPFGAPGVMFVMTAPLIWPWPIAYALSMTGTMAASVVGFSFTRFVARDWVSSKVPARFKKYEGALVRRAFLTVFMLRFIFWMPQALHAFFGVSKVRFSTHFWGSLAGYVVPLFFLSYFGADVIDALMKAPREAWVSVAAFVIVTLLVIWLRRRRRVDDVHFVDAGEDSVERP